MRVIGTLMALASLVFLAACGERVQVPPASKGMVLTANGYKGDIVPPSQFRLSPCLPWQVCERLVIVEAGDTAVVESMEVLMPQDNLMLGAEVRFTMGLANDDSRLLAVFDRVTPKTLPGAGYNGKDGYGTSLDMVYQTYGVAVIRNVVRSVLSKYKIADVAANQAEVSEILRQEVSKALQKTPLEVHQFGLAGITYPKPIMDSMESAAQRKVDIEKAENSAQVDMREAQARLEVAKARREADLLEARTIREADDILAGGVTPELIRYRELQVLEKMAENQNAIFFPVEMIGSQGLEYRVLNHQRN